MEEVRNLRGGQAGSSAPLSSPARRFVENRNDCLDKCPLRLHFVLFPTICRLWVACSLRQVRSPFAFLVATLRWPPVRDGAGLAFFGPQNLGKPPSGVLRWSCCPQAHAGHVGRWVGVYDRAVDHAARLSRPLGSRPRMAAWRGKEHPAEKHVPDARSRKRAATPRSSGQTACCCAVHKRADTAPFGLWVQTPQRVHDVTGVRGWAMTRDQHAGACGARSVGSGSGRAGPL